MHLLNKRLYLRLCIFVTFVVLLACGILYYVQLKQAKKDKINALDYSARQLATNLSIYLKVNDYISIERLLKESYLASESSFVAVDNALGDAVYAVPQGAVSQRQRVCRDKASAKINYFGQNIGTLSYCIDIEVEYLNFVAFFTLLFLILASSLSYLLTRVIAKDTREIYFLLSEIDKIDLAQPETRTDISNCRNRIQNESVVVLYDKIQQLLDKLRDNITLIEEKKKNDAIILIASQVAHDIRSPLAALSAATQGLSELPEDKRIMIRSAVQRIGDIANDLAGRGKQKQADEGAGETVQLLSGIIDALISEKRLQFRSRLDINIQSTLDARAYGLFAKIEPAQFKRVLSNLVNNAVEAIADHGTVSIGMKQNRDGLISITVSDTGAGIPPEILSKLTQKGATFGKKDGQGLGLFHARESVEAWGGEIKIESRTETPPASSLKEGVPSVSGTTVTITLPFEREPAWFVPELVVYPGTAIIILDDDESIHQIWKARFETEKGGVTLHHFSNGAALRSWHAQAQIKEPLLILCDYEILGSNETGLDVIKSLKLAEHTTLVTSRFEEKNVRENCEQLGIRLLPKNLAGFVPIKFVEIPSDLEFVLIDDSRMNRSTWEIMARAKKRKVITFERPKDFYAVAERVNKDAKLYVDLNLGNGVSGIDITREISGRGFENIFLYTGEDHVDTQDMPWIKGVVGKSLPFGR